MPAPPNRGDKLPFCKLRWRMLVSEMSEAVTWRERISARLRRRDGRSRRERRSDSGCVTVTKQRNFRIAGNPAATP